MTTVLFKKCSSNRWNFKIPAVHFSVDGEHFEVGSFKNYNILIII